MESNNVARVCQSIKFPQQLLVPQLTVIRRSVSEININLPTTCALMLCTLNTLSARDLNVKLFIN